MPPGIENAGPWVALEPDEKVADTVQSPVIGPVV
jgi:hypothetical protein